MSEPIAGVRGPTSRGEQFRFGLRGLIVVILVLSLVFGWVGNAHRRAQEQSALVAELVGVGVNPSLREPTGLGFWIKKRFPDREGWVRDRIGEGWLSTPTVFLCWNLDDERVPIAVDRLRRLGTVREVHYQGSRLTGRGLEPLRSGLPGIEVVPRAKPEMQRYFLSKTGEQFALGGLLFEASLAVILIAILVLCSWPLRSLVSRRRRAPIALYDR